MLKPVCEYMQRLSLRITLGCLVRYGSGKPNGTVFRCPCSSGLTCHGNHVFDMPLGETGT
ncbi:hypothetical protein DPMN_114766 [Dreissena polymorpha]|uniref:Uncharacterized protein n=1 Tax=Dreissena polymorpha TaxID=45954 RepID=A0A9D4QST4_DREPO|nr:hypothetical protein DPMN_114766 [Dreissena polymorpha]